MSGLSNAMNGASLKFTDTALVQQYANSIKGLNLQQAQLALSTKILSDEQKEQILVQAGLKASEDAIQGELLQSTLIQKGLNDEKINAILISAGVMDADTKELIADKACTKADLEAALAQELKNKTDERGILTALGLGQKNIFTAKTFKLLTASIWENIKSMLAWMVSNPFGQILLAAGALMGVVGIIDLLTTSVDEHREQLENLKGEYSELKSELDSVNNELKTIQQRISELESKGKLTFTESEELENLRKQSNELQRQNDLLERKEKLKKKEVNEKFVETMNADAGKIEFASGKIKRTETRGGRTQEVAITDVNEKDYSFLQVEKLSELYKEREGTLTEEEKEVIDRKIENTEKYLEGKYDEWSEDAEGIDYIQNPSNDDEKAVNEWLDFVNDFQDKMAIAMGEGSAKENAFNRLVDNWKFDELLNPLQQLGKEGKVTLDELKKRMDDPVFVEFVNKLKDIGFISDTTDGSLRFLASAFNGTTTSAKNYLSTLDSPEAFQKFINNIDDEAKALGTTKEELATLIGYHLTFDNTSLKTDDKIKMLNLLQTAIGNTSAEMKYLLTLFNVASGNFDTTGMTDDEVRARRAHTKHYLKNKYGFDFNETEIPEKDPYVPSGGSSKGSGGSGSDKNEALDNYLEYAESLYKVHQDEAKYINDLQWASNNLTKTDEERLEIAEKISEAYRDLADNRIKDIEHQNELLLNQGKTEYDLIENYKKIQDIVSEEANRYREEMREDLLAMGYIDEDEISRLIENSDYIQELQNTWWDNRNKEVDARFANSQDWIDERNRLNDWHLFGDSEVEAWERVVKWLKEEYPHAVDEIREAEENLFEARENNLNDVLNEVQRYADRVSDYYDNINEGLDKEIQKREALLQIQQKQVEVTDNLMDAQAEIDKALAEAKNSVEHLSEDEREKIFNEDDYDNLSEVISSTRDEIDGLSARFSRQIKDAYKNDAMYLVESITAEYERQVAMKERELEIAQSQVDLAKKQLQLNNVLAEKNVKQLVERNGQYVWEWVADSDAVKQANEELIDAQAKVNRLEYDKKQQAILNSQQGVIDGLNAQKSQNEKLMEDFNKQVADMEKAVEDATDPIKDFAYLAGILKDASIDVVNAFNVVAGNSFLNTATNGSGAQAFSGNGRPSAETIASWERDNTNFVPIEQPSLLDRISFVDSPLGNVAMRSLDSMWNLNALNYSMPTGIIENRTTNSDSKTYSFGDINIYEPADYNSFVKDLTTALKNKTL